MLGERIPASQALEWGLVNRVWPDGEFEAETEQLVDRLAAGPTKSYAGTKRQLNQWLYARMDEQLELEAQIQQEMANSGDFVEGVQRVCGEALGGLQGGLAAHFAVADATRCNRRPAGDRAAGVLCRQR